MSETDVNAPAGPLQLPGLDDATRAELESYDIADGEEIDLDNLRTAMEVAKQIMILGNRWPEPRGNNEISYF